MKLNAPSVSVIIPCFNRQDFVSEAIESALLQEVVGEVVVIDDGSTDDSWNRILAFGSQVKAFKIPNGGPAEARNVGVSFSTGDVIKFLDSDDVLISDAIEEQLDQYKTLPERSIPVGQISMQSNSHSMLNDSGKEIKLYDIGAKIIQVSRPLIPRSAFDEVGGFRYSTAHEDYEFFVRMAFSGWRFFEFGTFVIKLRDVASDRLTNITCADRFGEILTVFQRLEADLFRETSSTSQDLRRGVGRSAWSIARRSTRLGYYEIASELFELATRIAGRDARKGSELMLLLYRLLGPIGAERLAVIAKKKFSRQ